MRPGFGNRDRNFGSGGDNLRFNRPTDPFRFGPELTIGRTLADAFPDHQIALIKHAKGGTDVRSDWNPDWDLTEDGPFNNQDMYSGLLGKFVDATAELDHLELNYELAGMFWSQGGRDARVREKAEAYADNLRHVIESIREDYHAEDLPFVLARMEPNLPTGNVSHWEPVRAAHEVIAASDPFTAMITTDDIPDTSPTDAHWSTDGQYQVGSRFANAYLNLAMILLGDCNDDEVLDASDLSCVATIESRDAVLQALSSHPGDLDGDGFVRFDDFLELANNFGTGAASYAEGNIDLADGVTFSDFLILAENFGKVSNAAVAVPEPKDILIGCVTFLAAVTFRRISRSTSGNDPSYPLDF